MTSNFQDLYATTWLEPLILPFFTYFIADCNSSSSTHEIGPSSDDTQHHLTIFCQLSLASSWTYSIVSVGQHLLKLHMHYLSNVVSWFLLTILYNPSPFWLYFIQSTVICIIIAFAITTTSLVSFLIGK